MADKKVTFTEEASPIGGIGIDSHQPLLPETVQSPIGEYSQKDILFMMGRCKTAIKDSQKMTKTMLFQIATEVLSRHIIPGTDKYYWTTANKDTGEVELQTSWHYQYLSRWATYRVKQDDGQNRAFVPNVRALNVDERKEHKIKDGKAAAIASFVSQAARTEFMDTLKELRELLGDPKLALEEAKRLCPVEVHAVGVQVRYAPSGFSDLHDAEKMAIKNLVMRMFGLPSPKESRDMSKGYEWEYFLSDKYDPSVPPEYQNKAARLAQNTNSSTAGMEAEKRVDLMRDPANFEGCD